MLWCNAKFISEIVMLKIICRVQRFQPYSRVSESVMFTSYRRQHRVSPESSSIIVLIDYTGTNISPQYVGFPTRYNRKLSYAVDQHHTKAGIPILLLLCLKKHIIQCSYKDSHQTLSFDKLTANHNYTHNNAVKQSEWEKIYTSTRIIVLVGIKPRSSPMKNSSCRR